MLCALFMYVCVCVYRVNKLASSQRNSLAIQHHCLKGQNIAQDKEQNMNMPKNNERPSFSSLNEVATIKFNTGVSISLRR
jgi:hypothetical protein